MGTVDRDTAKLLIDALQIRLKAIEVNDQEERLTELEKPTGTVARNGSQARRF